MTPKIAAKRTFALLALFTGLGAIGIALVSACQEPSQLTLELTTDVPCADRVTSAIVVGTLAQTAESLSARPPAVQTGACTQRKPEDAFIGSLVVVPSGDDDGEVAIKVVAGIGIQPDQCEGPTDKRCITARRVRRFLSHTKVVLPITLNDACRGVPCGVEETCSRGKCISVRCEDTGTCDPTPRDAGVTDALSDLDARDAASPEGGPDAGGALPFTLALGRDFTCARRTKDGQVYCWGANDKGQLGQSGPSSSAATKVAVPRVAAIHAAADRVVALTPNGEVWGWGANTNGNLGPGPTGATTPVKFAQNAAIVSAGKSDTCILVNESVQCLGFGLGGTYPRLPLDAGIRELCCGATFVLGLSDTKVYGRRATDAAPTPGASSLGLGAGLADFGVQAEHLHCGEAFALLPQANGDVLGWGNNGYYPLTNDRNPDLVPSGASSSLKGFSQIAAGTDHACGINEDQDGVPRVYCWGSNEFEQCGRGAGTFTTPVKVANLPASKAVAIYAGGTHSCAQFEDRSAYCWGSNSDGQLGAPVGSSQVGPVAIAVPLQP